MAKGFRVYTGPGQRGYVPVSMSMSGGQTENARQEQKSSALRPRTDIGSARSIGHSLIDVTESHDRAFSRLDEPSGGAGCAAPSLNETPSASRTRRPNAPGQHAVIGILRRSDNPSFALGP